MFIYHFLMSGGGDFKMVFFFHGVRVYEKIRKFIRGREAEGAEGLVCAILGCWTSSTSLGSVLLSDNRGARNYRPRFVRRTNCCERF